MRAPVALAISLPLVPSVTSPEILPVPLTGGVCGFCSNAGELRINERISTNIATAYLTCSVTVAGVLSISTIGVATFRSPRNTVASVHASSSRYVSRR